MGKTRQSFDELYDRHFEAIFRYVLRRVADVAEAEDLTSQTFYKALKNYWRFRWTGGNVSAWLYRIATNEVASYYRRPAPNRAAAADPARVEPTDAMLAERRDAERELAQNRLYLDLHRALARLPDDDQALIVLRYFEHQSYDEITRVLGGRRQTLAMRAHRALKKLKAELEHRGIDHEELRGFLATNAGTGPAARGLPAEAAP